MDGDPNNGTGEAPAIEVRFRGVSIATNKVSLALLDTDGQYLQVIVRVQSDGRLDLSYGNDVIFSNVRLPGYAGLTGGRFAWGARTGGLNESSWIDDVQLAVGFECPPLLAVSRNGNNVVVTFTGVLESATSITGPWTALNGQTSPFVFSADQPARFFRSRNP